MSQYISTEREELQQVASNLGWSEFCEWVDTLDLEDYPALHHLRQHGFDNDPDELLGDVEDAIAEGSPSDDIRSVAQGIADFLHEHQDAGIILVSNGMTSDGEDEDEEEDDFDDSDAEDIDLDEDEDEEPVEAGA